MEQFIEELTVETPGRSLTDVTRRVASKLSARGGRDGLLTLFLRHTSASLLIGENADPDVPPDLLDALDRIAPEDAPYRHTVEGPDDMPAHVKAAVTGVSLQVPVQDGRMMLGTWQGLFLAEHREAPHRRRLVLHFAGTLER